MRCRWQQKGISVTKRASHSRGFWQQEEVPRWMGLTLVVIYVIGLGAVAWTAQYESQTDHQFALEQRAHGVVTLLTTQLGQLPGPNEQNQNQFQRVLAQFCHSQDADQLRIIDQQRKVVASSHLDEMGGRSPLAGQVGPTFPEMVYLADQLGSRARPGRFLFRAPVRFAGDQGSYWVEGMLDWSSSLGWVMPQRAVTLAVILAAVGVLLLLYRRMRSHFRGITRIAERLSNRPGELTNQLESLRVADSLGSVAQAWNELIHMMEELHTQARRATASRELREALERSSGGELATVLHAVPDGLIYLTEGRTIRYANAMARRLLGWSPPKGQTDRRSVPARLDQIETSSLGKQLLAVIEAARSPDGPFETCSEIVRNEPDQSSYRVRILPLGPRRVGECVAVITDISQQVRADKAREEFVSQVTHELRTPLANIRAYAETLSSGMFDDPKVIAECYNVITKETRRLARLIEDILSISQIEVGTLNLIKDDVEVASLLSETVRDLRGLADEKNLDLQLDLPGKLGTIQGDRDKLAVVLNNLLGNAIKYTPTGGAVRVGAKMADQQLTVTLKDTGIGIDPTEHERIFEKFYRGNDPMVQAEPGTGIGLTTAREIARCHGGDIEVMSNKGQGATFVMRVPVGQTVEVRQQTVGV